MNGAHIVIEPLNADVIVPLVVPAVTFSAITAIVAISLYFRYRAQRLRQELYTSFLERGVPIPPALLSERPKSRNADLRRGLVLLLGGIALSGTATLAGGREVAGFGLIPALVGVAFLIVWKVEQRMDADAAERSNEQGQTPT